MFVSFCWPRGRIYYMPSDRGRVYTWSGNASPVDAYTPSHVIRTWNAAVQLQLSPLSSYSSASSDDSEPATSWATPFTIPQSCDNSLWSICATRPPRAPRCQLLFRGQRIHSRSEKNYRRRDKCARWRVEVAFDLIAVWEADYCVCVVCVCNCVWHVLFAIARWVDCAVPLNSSLMSYTEIFYSVRLLLASSSTASKLAKHTELSLPSNLISDGLV